MSGERTVTDPVEEIDPPTAADEPPPTRGALGRLPPFREPPPRVSLQGPPARASGERTVTDPVEEIDPPTNASADPRPAPTRGALGRLPPLHELLARVSPAGEPARVSGEPTIAEPVEEIELPTAADDPPPVPGSHALGRLAPDPSPSPPRPPTPPPPPPPRSPPPPPPPRAVAGAETVLDVPPPADTVRDLSPAVPDTTDSNSLPPMVTVERPSAARVVADSATVYCKSCARRVARAEIQMLTREGRKVFAVCSVCNGYLDASAPRSSSGAPRAERAPRSASAPRARSLEWILVEAIGWPVARQVLPTLLGLTCVFWLLSSAWALGLAHVRIAGLALASCVLLIRAAAVIQSTHRGDLAPPPLFGEDTNGAVMRHLSVLFVGGLPLIAALASGALGVRSSTERTMLVVGAITVFSLYVPAAQIVVASRETLAAALNPFRPIRFAFRVGRPYLIPCAVLLGIAIAHLVAVGVTMMLGVAMFGSPTVGWGLLESLVMVTGVLVEARMLGLVVREHPFDLALV